MSEVETLRMQLARMSKLELLLEKNSIQHSRCLCYLNNELSHISDAIKYQQQRIEHTLSSSALVGEIINPLMYQQVHDFLSATYTELDVLYGEREVLIGRIEAKSDELVRLLKRKENLQCQYKINYQQLHADLLKKELADVCELHLLRGVMCVS